MLHPKILELLEMAQGFQIDLSTDVAPLDAQQFGQTGLQLATLQMSFVGYDRESYETTYVGGKFDHVAANLRQIAEQFPVRSPDTRLLVNGVSLQNDPSFVDKTVAFVRSVGFAEDQIEIKLPNNFGGLYTGSPIEESSGIHTYKNLNGAQLEICSVLLNNPGVYVDGLVTVCGCLDNSSALIVGDIRQESLREMRYGPRFEALLRAFAEEDISQVPLCKDCDLPYCTSRNVNLVSPEFVTQS